MAPRRTTLVAVLAALLVTTACGGGGAATDTTAPSVSLVRPANGAVAVEATAVVQAVLDEAVDCVAVNGTSLTLTAPAGTAVAGVVSCAGTTMTFTPTGPLAWSATFQARLVSAVRDLAGNRLPADFSWSFTTRANPDTTSPTFISISPSDGETGVVPGATIRATFSEPVQLGGSGFGVVVLDGSGNPVSGTTSASGSVVTFVPGAPLIPGVQYEVSLGTAILDLAGNPLTSPLTFHFVTATLDASFGTGGLTLTSLSSGDDWANSLLFQSSGKILVAALVSNGQGGAVLRYLPDGTLDPTFGPAYSAGRVALQLLPMALAPLPNGSFYVAGGIYDGTLDLALSRYGPDGVQDSTFGGFGLATVPRTPGDDVARAIGLQSSGAIVLAGSTPTGSIVVRFLPDGRFDGSFGIVTVPMDVRALSILPDDRIVLGGSAGQPSSTAAARLLPGGALDTSFGTNGVATYRAGASSDGTALSTLPDGSVLVAGSMPIGAWCSLVLVRFTAAGGIDTSFGIGGAVVQGFTNGCGVPSALARSDDGRVLVAGTLFVQPRQYGLLMRFRADGSVDPGFTSSGELRIDWGGTTDSILAAALQADGKIVVAGRGGPATGGTDVALARIWP